MSLQDKVAKALNELEEKYGQIIFTETIDYKPEEYIEMVVQVKTNG